MKVVQSSKMASFEMLSMARLSILQQLLVECLQEVPNPAFVTVTVTRYEEDTDDPAAPPKQARPWPSAEGADPEAAP